MTLTIKTPENKTYKGSSKSLQGRFSNASDDVYNQKQSEAIADALFRIPLEEKERLRRLVLSRQQQKAPTVAEPATVKPEITGPVQKTTKQVPGGTETTTTSDATIRGAGEPSYSMIQGSDGRTYVYAKIVGPNGEVYEGSSVFSGNIGTARTLAAMDARAKMSRREAAMP